MPTGAKRWCLWATLWVWAGCATTAGAPQDDLRSALEGVEQRLDAASLEMGACFRRELGEGADRMDGRAVVRFEIDTDGLVRHAELVESTLGQEKAELCVLDTVRRIYFETWVGREPARLTKPFSFFAGR